MLVIYRFGFTTFTEACHRCHLQQNWFKFPGMFLPNIKRVTFFLRQRHSTDATSTTVVDNSSLGDSTDGPQFHIYEPKNPIIYFVSNYNRKLHKNKLTRFQDTKLYHTETALGKLLKMQKNKINEIAILSQSLWAFLNSLWACTGWAKKSKPDIFCNNFV